MKRMKLLTPLMVGVAAVAPMMTALTSCGKVNYTEKISEFKDKTITTFMDLTRKTHRMYWVEGECYSYIKSKMSSYGFKTPAGYDKWSTVPEVADKIAVEKQKWAAAGVSQDRLPTLFQEYGNIWYDIPASKGMEDAPKIILHAHMDVSMAFAAPEKTTKVDWANETENAINVSYDRENDLLYTDKKVSLGADNGIGIAAMLTMAEIKDKFTHPGIRLLFTAGESEGTEIYASGADFLQNDQLHNGERWRTKDREETVPGTSYLAENAKKPFGEKGEFPYIISTEGIYKNYVYSSCGGIHECQFNDTAILLTKKNEGTTPETRKTQNYEANQVIWQPDWTSGKNLNLFKLNIAGLYGGQSAKYINSGYANALQLAMNLLYSSDYNCRLFSGTSAPAQYAIPREAELVFATLLTKQELEQNFKIVLDSYKNSCPNDNWDGLKCELTEITDKTDYVYSLSPVQTRKIAKLFAWDLIYGPVDWFDKDQKTVKTSCNFGKLDFAVDKTGKTKFSVFNVCRSADKKSLALFYEISHGILDDAFSSLYMYDCEKLQARTITEAWALAEEKTFHNDKPVWEKNANDKMVQGLIKGFKNMGVNPDAWDNHGWIETACFIDTYEKAGWATPQMSCLGPEIRKSHEVDEEAWTDSLNQCFGALLYLFEHVKQL